MLRYSAVLAVVGTLSACTTSMTDADLQATRIAMAAQICESQSNPNCKFVNSPVRLRNDPVTLPAKRQQFFPTANRLEFLDAQGRRWIAPSTILTDGASIPEIFIPIIGVRRSPEFLNAAAIHDAYCGIGNEQNPVFHDGDWEDVHRMFYEALRVGGTGATKSKIMFAAVYLAGPRWEDAVRERSQVPVWNQVESMQRAKRYIEKYDPDLRRLIRWLTELEREYVDRDEDHKPATSHILAPAEPETDPANPEDGQNGGDDGIEDQGPDEGGGVIDEDPGTDEGDGVIEEDTGTDGGDGDIVDQDGDGVDDGLFIASPTDECSIDSSECGQV